MYRKLLLASIVKRTKHQAQDKLIVPMSFLLIIIQKKLWNNSCSSPQVFSFLPLKWFFSIGRSISICGARTLMLLKTSILASGFWSFPRDFPSQSTNGHFPLHRWTPQLICMISRSGNLNAWKLVEKTFWTTSSSWFFDQPSSMSTIVSVKSGMICESTGQPNSSKRRCDDSPTPSKATQSTTRIPTFRAKMLRTDNVEFSPTIAYSWPSLDPTSSHDLIFVAAFKNLILPLRCGFNSLSWRLTSIISDGTEHFAVTSRSLFCWSFESIWATSLTEYCIVSRVTNLDRIPQDESGSVNDGEPEKKCIA